MVFVRKLACTATSEVKTVEFSVSLKENYVFRRLYSKGKSAATPLLVVYFRKNGFGTKNRLGITVGTKVGKAVVRNRVRRRLREIYRLNEARLLPGRDMIIVARVRAKDAAYAELERDFLALCGRLDLLRQENEQ